MELDVSVIKNKVANYLFFLRKKKLILFAFCLIFTLAGIAYTIISKPKFEANFSFFINEGDKGLNSALLSLAGQSGLLLGGGSASPTEDKVTFLLQSKRILGEALLKRAANKDGKIEIIGNSLMNEFNILQGYKGDDLMDGFDGLKNATLDSLNSQENKAIDDLIEILTKWKIFSFEIQKKKSLVAQPIGVILIQVTLKNEVLSKVLAESIYEELSQFYIVNAIEKQLSNVELLKYKLDSTESVLNAHERTLGYEAENNINLIRISGKTEELRLKKEVELLHIMRAEFIKNYELAKLSMEQQRPYFKPIDVPRFPLKKNEKSKIKFGLAGLFLGFFTGIFILSLNYFKLNNAEDFR